MEINEIYAQYCRFWDLFKAIPKYRNRRACSFNQWKARDDAAREAMLDHLKKNGPPRNANPYFWLQDFEEPEPENLNGSRRYDTLVKTTPLVSAVYNGSYGVYTLDDALKHNLDIRYGMNFKYQPQTQS